MSEGDQTTEVAMNLTFHFLRSLTFYFFPSEFDTAPSSKFDTAPYLSGGISDSKPNSPAHEVDSNLAQMKRSKRAINTNRGEPQTNMIWFSKSDAHGSESERNSPTDLKLLESCTAGDQTN
jgi:hypothetical protein